MQMAFFEASYDLPVLTISEGLNLISKPFVSFQTDFGTTTSSDLISLAEPSTIGPQGNMKLLAQVNLLNSFFFRYRREIFVAELSSQADFVYVPYEGNEVELLADSQLLMTSEFRDMEIGIAATPFRDKRSIIEVGVYHAVWQRPRVVRNAYSTTAEEAPDAVYHSVQDFWGILFGASGVLYKKDQQGNEWEWLKVGYYFKSGSGKMKLSSNFEQTIFTSDGNQKRFNNVEMGAYWRTYWRIAKSVDFGVDFRYVFQATRPTGSSSLLDEEFTSDQTIFLTGMVQVGP
jgi:hypothetical protein